MHMFVQFALAAFLRFTWPAHFRPARVPTREDYGKKAVPTAVATGLDIGLSNLSLKTITLSFYTMCKSSSLIFVLLFAFLFHLEIFSWRLVAVIFLIFSGVLLMVATETHFSLDGFLLVISASALGGLRWSLTQIMLKNKKMGFDNPAATIYWLTPTMGLLLAILSAAKENWVTLFRGEFFSGSTKILETLFFLSAPGVVAFCMVLSEFYIIQRTGVVPMSIAGIAKEVTTISISSWFFGDQLTPLNIVGVAITVCGIALFTFHKYRKSLEADVPLDAHGNPVTGGDGDGTRFTEGEARESLAEEEEEFIRLNPEGEAHDEFGERRPRSGDSQLLFSADDGDEDADELRSLRSSKFKWKPNNTKEPSAGAGRLEEASAAVARESIELERMWTRDQS
ncbi:TPT-domain-containing protein [Macrolepiota fuliginosa MF-IS2]|uniref:TPT-domain-containing protein n=1 Tax=Macrolepiota fuliginosa MF-IS2 TaxID=1400762 RepID=A0A9P5XNB9_9AGAR|nr:TPT-domain-containing protein [Macrolepiota fuliginosa MF-IS2]